MYERILSESRRIWNSRGGAQAAVAFVEQYLGTTDTDAQERGRLLNLLAAYYKRAGQLSLAHRRVSEALELLSDPRDRIDAICNAMDLCVLVGRVEDGTRLAKEAQALLDDLPEDSLEGVRAILLFNLGRLHCLSREFEAAEPLFRSAAELFSNVGKRDEALMAKTALAEVLIELGRLQDATELCSQVLVAAQSDYVVAKAGLLMSVIQASLGNAEEAEVYLASAAAAAARHIPVKDYRLLLELLSAMAKLWETTGHAGANFLRTVIRQFSSLGKVEVREWR